MKDVKITEKGVLVPQSKYTSQSESWMMQTVGKYVIEFEYEGITVRIEVPEGFLVSADYGIAWTVHEYLYSTHAFDSQPQVTRTRKEVDELVADILYVENMGILSPSNWSVWGATWASWLDTFGSYEKEWTVRKEQGPKYASAEDIVAASNKIEEEKKAKEAKKPEEVKEEKPEDAKPEEEVKSEPEVEKAKNTEKDNIDLTKSALDAVAPAPQQQRASKPAPTPVPAPAKKEPVKPVPAPAQVRAAARRNTPVVRTPAPVAAPVQTARQQRR
jgi:hypothetical protein